MTTPSERADRPGWWFPEYRPVGVDLASSASVAAYDARQGTDPVADDALLDRLGVGAGTVLVDLACGTGAFAVRAAARGAEVHGVDVGSEMLAHAARRADAAGVTVHWHRAGFLDNHIREEYSTYDWILAGMLDRVGLDVVERRCSAPTQAEFLCRKAPTPH